jgi:hypothetical protein
MRQGNHGQRHIHRELRFQCMTEIGTGGAHGKVAMLLKKNALLGGRRGGPGSAGNDRGVAGFDLGLELVPQPRQRGGNGARRTLGTVGKDGGEPGAKPALSPRSQTGA